MILEVNMAIDASYERLKQRMGENRATRQLVLGIGELFWLGTGVFGAAPYLEHHSTDFKVEYGVVALACLGPAVASLKSCFDTRTTGHNEILQTQLQPQSDIPESQPLNV